MKVFSSTTSKTYDVEESIAYKNMLQSAFMLSKYDCELLDVYENRGKITMVFPRWMHEKYIREWAERPRQNKDEANG